MVWWWWVIPAAVGVFGLAFVLSGMGWMFRGKPFKGGRGVVSGGALLAIGAVASLVGLNIQTYNRLSYERPIARVELDRVDGATFTATVIELDDEGQPFGEPKEYTLNGQQWQMDARVITWKPWANVLGLDSQYELQNIWGRDVSDRRNLRAEGQAMEVERPGINAMELMEGLGRFSPVEATEREFGSAVYMPMVDGAVYEVRMTQEGLAVDPGNDLARGAVEAGMLQNPMAAPPAP
jgi:hypothetical protein